MISKDCMSRILSLRNHFPKLDEKGGILLPLDLKIRDIDFMKYRHLPVNWDIEAVRNDDLPDEFSPDSVKLVDIFRRKTIDLDYEVMLIFDYKTAELIYCFVNNNGESNQILGSVDDDIFIERNIATIHNHPKGYASPPSAENFQILELEFEEYELVSSYDSLWILESKSLISEEDIYEIKNNIKELYDFSISENISNHDEVYGNLLMKYINSSPFEIKLTRRNLR